MTTAPNFSIHDNMYNVHVYVQCSPDDSSQRVAFPSLPLDSTYCREQHSQTTRTCTHTCACTCTCTYCVCKPVPVLALQHEMLVHAPSPEG